MIKVTQINDSKESGGKQPYQQNMVSDADGLSPTIDQSAGRFSVAIKSATKQGFETASEGDSVNMSVPNSATRRGRVGKQQAQTLDTASQQAVIIQTPRGYNEGGEHEDCPTISSNSFQNNNHVKISPVLTPDRINKRQNGRRFKNEGSDSFTITAQDKHGVIIENNEWDISKKETYKYEITCNCGEVYIGTLSTICPKCNTLTSSYTNEIDQNALQLRDGRDNRSCLRAGRNTELGFEGISIRRLTEIEVERLQGFEDNHTKYGLYPTIKISQQKFNELSNEEKIKLFENTVKKEVSSTQRYKQCGNAVTVDIVQLIASKF